MILTALPLIASLAAAATQTPWTPADPSGAFADDSPEAVAVLGFNDQLQNRGFHQICDKIPFEAGYRDNNGLGQSRQQGENGFLVGGTNSASRQFYRYPSGQLALIDSLNIDLSMGYSRKLLHTTGPAPLTMFFSSEFQGQSLVIRPLQNDNSCQQLGKLVKVTSFKTAFPLSAKRISKMEVGELWKIPASFQIGIGPQAGFYPSSPALSGAFILSLTYSKQRGGMATLYRMSPDVLRFRVRIDRIQARTLDGQIIGSPLPAINAGKPDVEKAMARALSKPVADVGVVAAADALNTYLSAVFEASSADSTSDQVVLEYLLNPNDQAQMEGLQRALHGDLAAISPAALRKDLPLGGRDAGIRAFLDGLSDANGAAMGASASFAGADRQKSTLRYVHIRLPMFLNYDHTKSRSEDRFVTRDPAQGELDLRSASVGYSRGMIDFPGMDGNLKRVQVQRSVTGVSVVKAGGADGEPMVVYVRQEGYLRASRRKALKMTRETADVMRPVVVPPPVELPAGTEKKGFTGEATLTVVLGKKAIEELVAASPARILEAFAQSLAGHSRELMQEVISGQTVSNPSDVSAAQFLEARAEAVVRDFEKIKEAATAQARTSALVRLISGQASSRLSYDDAMKLILSLVDPTSVAADFLSTINGSGKGAASVARRYLLNAAVFQKPELRRYAELNRRFMQPLPLSD